jgi:hypothetical protein
MFSYVFPYVTDHVPMIFCDVPIMFPIFWCPSYGTPQTSIFWWTSHDVPMIFPMFSHVLRWTTWSPPFHASGRGSGSSGIGASGACAGPTCGVLNVFIVSLIGI